MGVTWARFNFLECLEETSENSPGFQAWECVYIETSSPEGMAEISRPHWVCARIETLPLAVLPKKFFTLNQQTATVSKSNATAAEPAKNTRVERK